jgi:ABC-2 type transport system ATP-binding protein
MADNDPEVVLKTIGLSKKYGRLSALDNLNLEVRRGHVYGFLGPNGSGKTTAIGLMLGVLRPNAGHVELFGLDCRQHLASVLKRTGAIIETPAFYPHLVGRDNLRVFGLLSGDVTRKMIDETLDFVGLGQRGRDKVRTYSLGMKQRLGLAVSLLRDPELVVLDEPTNGLDPAGMREFRDLIKELGRAGKTVFVSSHLLSEVEQMCDHVGIVKGGKLITQGSVAALLRREDGLEMKVTAPDRAVDILRGIDWVRDVRRHNDSLEVDAPVSRAAEISEALANERIYLAELRPRATSLEEFFLEVTGEGESA